MSTANIPSSPLINNFNELPNVDDVIAKLHADNLYKPFEEDLKKLFESKSVPINDSLISIFRSIYDVGIAAGRKIEQFEQERKKKESKL